MNEKYEEHLKKSNEKLDAKAGPATIQTILSMIEKSINKEYFKEKRLEPFFEQCFSLTEPEKLMAEKKFQEFL